MRDLPETLFVVGIFLLFILFIGTPDLHDGIIKSLGIDPQIVEVKK